MGELKSKHYLFECVNPNSELEGELFLVEATTLEEARKTAYDFDLSEAKFIRTMTEFEAENSGLDEF